MALIANLIERSYHFSVVYFGVHWNVCWHSLCVEYVVRTRHKQ